MRIGTILRTWKPYRGQRLAVLDLTFSFRRYRSTKEKHEIHLEKLKKKNLNIFQKLRQEEADQGEAEAATVISNIHNKVKAITPNDSFVSSTKFDEKGNITEVSKKYPKMQFLKDNNLFPRDLRKIDTSSIEVAPVIMVRENNCILVNLLHVKAIIKGDNVMVFDTSTSKIARMLGVFMYDLEMKLKLPPGNVNYEFRVLESILVSVMSSLEVELKTHISTCGSILAELEDQVDRLNLQELLISSKKLSSFYQRAALIRDVLEDLLDSDEDLVGMYLSKPPPTMTEKGGQVDTDTNELESMLEAYYRQCDEIVQQAGSLVNDIKVTEDIINIILDANRNSLMLFELKVTVYTLGFTAATLLPAFYGMNLKNFVEESPFGFGAVVLFSVLQGIIITVLNFRRLHRVQKMTMMEGSTPNIQRQYLNPKYLSWKHMCKYRFFHGYRSARNRHPTSYEKDLIWRMINDDKPMK